MKSRHGIFVGYTENTKGYRVFFPDVNMVSIEREIIFTPESIRKNADDNEETLVRLDINNSEEMQSEEEPEDAISTRDDEEEVFQQPITIAEKTDDRLRPRQTLKPPTRFDDFATSYFSVDEDEPTTYEEAMAGDYASEWQEAIDRELEALSDNNTWKLVDKPKEKNIFRKCT
ncbi:hypothetical protein QE152_g30212 [Popillia japonica]|uniref:Retroviral polymerase SH3-like domain-containing protein n=1 Tax=Popillia japonica TaxID=7064 RepID=A0AAW1JFT5_POPJA